MATLPNRRRTAENVPIPAVSSAPSGSQPTWSVMIPTYNCAHLLAQLLPGVVGQVGDRDDVEIWVIDDASSDDPVTVVDRCGGGVVRFVRNETGLGAIGNFNECIRRSTGKFVHLLHGDDGVLPGFYAAMEAALDRNYDALAAVCRAEYIDDRGEHLSVTRSERSGSGRWTNAIEALAISNRVRPSAIVARRSTYESLGGFRDDLPHAADWEMWARIAANGPIEWVDEVLALYRVHDASDTAGRVRTGVNVTERLEAMEVIHDLVPAEDRGRLRRKAAGYSALFALRTAGRCARRGDPQATVRQLLAAIRSIAHAAR